MNIDIKEYILNTRLSYNQYITRTEQWRILGVLEAGLVFVGKLKTGENFEYQMLEFDGFFGGKERRKEYYHELILRLTDEYLKQNI